MSRGDTLVLDGASLTVSSGEVVGLMGPSGSGKTTLLAVLAGLLVPTSGDVSIGGDSITRVGDRRRSAIRLAKLGLVFQGDELLPDLTIEENVSLPLRFGRSAIGSTTDSREMVRPVLEQLEIDAIAERLPEEVSGGQLQRAAIARAIIHRPLGVLADEPTTSLDGEASRNAMSLLIGLARASGSAVIVVTHDDAVAAGCDRVLTLSDGQLRSPLRDHRL
ncbi:hypothetical protein ASC61_01895 [Aeromicrobium sp. Root344]|uniref:ABC transporter ATP-binding protein n=1 Tax=Aeromicrobium sp. Root344 TaxID=1736521 RepID=UPI0006FE8D89|nr:ATP-binding cassette domain-containing protein [Aeromicrobium sp. Root344]KQV73861.1 hypothetical protein ASC61_01895 [Aeromicrobium sp. Root344]